MRDFLKKSGRWLNAGWLWALVLLALPNCALPSYSGLPPDHLEPGDLPRSSAVMCDIPTVESIQALPPESCATDDDLTTEIGIPLTQAAIALRNGDKRFFGLDYSPEAVALCGGKPRKIKFQGMFPEGYQVCLNCKTQIPDVYKDAAAVCVIQCEDLIRAGEGPQPANIHDFCVANARVSTNFDKNACYPGACSDSGIFNDASADPRESGEDLVWVNTIGTTANSSDLMRNTPATGNNDSDFNAGAHSAQLITSGDGWVEFEASESDKSHILGLRHCPDPCDDQELAIEKIDAALSLNKNGEIFVIENPPFSVAGPLGPYNVNNVPERFRARFTDNHDNTATISFWRVVGPCSTPGTPCAENFLYTSGIKPQYPIAVKALFREDLATLAKVNLVYIRKQQ